MKKLIALGLMAFSFNSFAIETVQGKVNVTCGRSDEIIAFLVSKGYSHDVRTEQVLTDPVKNAVLTKFHNAEGKFTYWLYEPANDLLCWLADSRGEFL